MPGEEIAAAKDAVSLDTGLSTAPAYGMSRCRQRSPGSYGSGVAREEPFITSKLWNDMHGEGDALLSRPTLKDLLEYLDLYLIHWPFELPRAGGRCGLRDPHACRPYTRII